MAGPLLDRATTLLSDGKEGEAKSVLLEALQDPGQHFAAFGALVSLAIVARDQPRLDELFETHRAYPFETPENFQGRIEFYELRYLRRIYNQAVQDFMDSRWPEAEQGFSQLLGDAVYHRQSVAWLFRIAMRQKDFERAQFIAGLAKSYADDATTSPNILGACSAQRKSDQQVSQPALSLISEELKLRNAYAESLQTRLEAQQIVYVAMIRLHNEIDQCFRFAMSKPAEARPLFPDLPDKVLAYLAR
ncbi:MAG: hypothetical protein ABIQ54_00250 [Gammaproteobacteria bacterium]